MALCGGRRGSPPSALSRWTVGFALLQLALLLASIFVAVVGFIWRRLLSAPIRPDTSTVFLHLAVSPEILNGGIVFSATTVVSVVIALWTLTTRPSKDNARTKPVVVYIFCLGVVVLATLTIATVIWFSSLRERRNFTPVWTSLSDEIKIFLQDDLKCCGWNGPTPAGGLTPNLQQGFCANPASLPVNPDPNVSAGCIDDFCKKMDFVLNNIFTTIYGFMVIEFALLLAAMTIAQLRLQERRFLRIDFKFMDGKGGFV